MACVEYERLMDAFLAGELSDRDRSRLETHLAICPACEERLAASSGNLAKLSNDESEDLVQAVLMRTSGVACEGARDLIPRAVDGLLHGDEARLLGQHVEHCADCGALKAALAWVTPLLPAMTLIEPDADFTRAVLAETTGAARRRTMPAWLTGLAERWRGLILRPRFSLEGAFALTLVMLLLFGTPISPAKDAPSRALAVIQSGPGPIAASLAPDLRGLGEDLGREAGELWRRSGGRAVDVAGDLGISLERRRRAASAPTASLGANLVGLGRAVGTLDWSGADDHLGAVGLDCKEIWRALTHGAPNTSEMENG